MYVYSVLMDWLKSQVSLFKHECGLHEAKLLRLLDTINIMCEIKYYFICKWKLFVHTSTHTISLELDLVNGKIMKKCTDLVEGKEQTKTISIIVLEHRERESRKRTLRHIVLKATLTLCS
jgi:hypothetical protein